MMARAAVLKTLRRYGTSDASTLLAANLAVASTALVTGVVTARTLGPAGRGDFAILVFWPALAAVVLDIAVRESVTLRVASGRILTGTAVATGLVLASGCSLFAGSLVYLALPWLLRTSQQHLLWASRGFLLFIPAMLFSEVLVGGLLGLGLFGRVASVRITAAMLYTGTVLVLAGSRLLTPVRLAYATLGMTAIPIVLGVPMLLRHIRGSIRIERHNLVDQATLGVKLQSTRAASLLSSFEERGIAAMMFSQTDVGLFQIPIAATWMLSFIGQALSQLLFARIAPLSGADRSALVSRIHRTTLALTTTGAVIAAVGAPFLISRLYGPGFAPATGPTMIVCVASIFAGSSLVLQNASKAAEKIWWPIGAEVVAMLASATFALLLCRRWPLMGLAAAYSAGRLTSYGVSLYGARRVVSVTPAGLGSGRREVDTDASATDSL
jgi:O-antigen/teichoic acid export membrane protein